MSDHIHTSYSTALVLLSYLVSVLGSFTALQLAVSIPLARGTGQRLQSVLGAGAALGVGAIWSMHFIGMLACDMDGMQVTYDLPLTLASAVVALLSCALGLGIVGIGQFHPAKLLFGGTITGLGVAAMHYMGMAAMRMQATPVYDMGMVILSVLIAIVAAIAALWLAFNMRGWAQMLGSALVMGVAVCGMHYTGMHAVSFMADSSQSVGDGLAGAYLGVGVFAVATVLLSIALVTTLLRRQQRANISI